MDNESFDLWVGTWLGIFIMCSLNLVLIIFSKNTLDFDWYMLIISVVVLIILTVLMFKKKVKL